jgi:lysozyme
VKTSQRGIDLIKQSEGCELEAYPDPGTGAEPWTIGYGSTKGVTKGMKISQAEAEFMLVRDLLAFEAGVTNLVKVPITQNQFDALVCFSYNVGLGNLQSSTLLKMVNNRDFAGAAQQFQRWNKAAGKVLNGLTKRRLAEAKLFSGD